MNWLKIKIMMMMMMIMINVVQTERERKALQGHVGWSVPVYYADASIDCMNTQAEGQSWDIHQVKSEMASRGQGWHKVV